MTKTDKDVKNAVMSERKPPRVETWLEKTSHAPIRKPGQSTNDFVEAISYYLSRYFDSTGRPYAFLDYFIGCQDPEVFWRTFHKEWSGFDAIPHEDFADLLEIYRQDWRPEFMPREDLQFYNSLPESVTVFRGQDQDAEIGLSWTLNRDVADGFAKGHRGIVNKSPVILTAEINKLDIASVQTDRNEAEIILFSAPVQARRPLPCRRAGDWRAAAGFERF